MHKIVHADVQQDYQILLSFADGVAGVVNLSHLVGKGVFAAWADYAEFQQASIGQAGELSWPCGVDLCPDALYLQVTGQPAEQTFPRLRGEKSHA